MSKLSTGVILCKLAKCIQRRVDDSHGKIERLKYWEHAKRETFFARDNAEVFIRWCRSFGVRDAVLFESDGLVMQRQQRTVILCLLEVARIASRYGILLPPPIQLSPTTLSVEDVSDYSEDEFLFAPTVVPSPKSGRCCDSGCSSGGRSPDAGSVLSKISSPGSSLKKRKERSVVVVVRSRSDDFLIGKSSSSPRVSPDRNASQVRKDTISSRLRCDATLSRSNSSIVSSKSTLSRTPKGGSTHSLSSLSRQKRSPLDKKVSELARQCLKDADRIHRISEGHYAFGDKKVYLRMVRGNNVVVRVGGGWDTLEHFLSVLDSNKRKRSEEEKKTPNKRRTTKKASSRT